MIYQLKHHNRNYSRKYGICIFANLLTAKLPADFVILCTVCWDELWHLLKVMTSSSANYLILHTLVRLVYRFFFHRIFLRLTSLSELWTRFSVFDAIFYPCELSKFWFWFFVLLNLRQIKNDLFYQHRQAWPKKHIQCTIVITLYKVKRTIVNKRSFVVLNFYSSLFVMKCYMSLFLLRFLFPFMLLVLEATNCPQG